MPRCIYCGTNIPPDIGLRCFKCDSNAATHKAYDKEFEYADEIEPQVAKIMDQAEYHSLNKAGQKAQEEFLRLYEQNLESRKDYRWADQEELMKKREGRILSMNEFMRLFTQCLPPGTRAWYTEKGGMANTLGLYVGHSGLYPKCNHNEGEPHYVGFVQVPFMQEFEELHFDPYLVPLGSKRRGWRTIGLRAIEQGVITEEKFLEVFGQPPTGPVSRRFRAYCHFLRNIPVPKTEIEVPHGN